jgi:hypothetical protein
MTRLVNGYRNQNVEVKEGRYTQETQLFIWVEARYFSLTLAKGYKKILEDLQDAFASQCQDFETQVTEKRRGVRDVKRGVLQEAHHGAVS